MPHSIRIAEIANLNEGLIFNRVECTKSKFGIQIFLSYVCLLYLKLYLKMVILLQK